MSFFQRISQSNKNLEDNKHVLLCGCKIRTTILTSIFATFGILYSLLLWRFYSGFISHYVINANLYGSVMKIIVAIHLISCMALLLGVYFKKTSLMLFGMFSHLALGIYFLFHTVCGYISLFFPGSPSFQFYVGGSTEDLYVCHPYLQEHFYASFGTFATVHLFVCFIPFFVCFVTLKSLLSLTQSNQLSLEQNHSPTDMFEITTTHYYEDDDTGSFDI